MAKTDNIIILLQKFDNWRWLQVWTYEATVEDKNMKSQCQEAPPGDDISK